MGVVLKFFEYIVDYESLVLASLQADFTEKDCSSTQILKRLDTDWILSGSE